MLWNYLSCLHCCLQRRTPEVFSAGFVADRYPPLPLLYLISTFTQHFIFSRTNKKKKIPFIFKHRTWTPFPTSNPPGEALQSGALLFPLPRRSNEQRENPCWRYAGGGKATRRVDLQLFGLSCLDNIPHRIASAAWFNSWGSPRQDPTWTDWGGHAEERSPLPNACTDARIAGWRKPSDTPPSTAAASDVCDGMKWT